MSFILPFEPNIPFQEVDVTLEGSVYRYYLQWSTRENIWYMDILTTEDTLIEGSIKMVLGTYLGWRSSNPLAPPGLTRLTDLSKQGREATLEDLGTRVVAIYTTVEEIDLILSLRSDV